jgi:elongation factor Ts
VYAILQKESNDVTSVDDLSTSVKEEIEALINENILVLGENIQIGSLVVKSTKAYPYNHAGAKLASLVYFEEGEESLMKELALQVAAMAPTYYSLDEIPQAEVDVVKNAARASLEDSGKPADIIEKIIEGKVMKEL